MSREHDKAASLLTERIDELEKREQELEDEIKTREELIDSYRVRMGELAEENDQLKADFESAALKFQETEAANAALVEKIAKLTGK